MKRFALTFGAGLLALGACAASAQNLRIGLQEDPDVLDPHRARTYVGRIVFTSLCDKLIDIDPKLHFVPQLATSWTFSEDNKTLTFKLREDALFHDGSKFDAAAAKANLDRAMTLPDSLRRGELGSVAKVEAPDAATLVLTLKQPDATLLAQLSDRAGMMLSPKTFGDDVAAVGRKPVCSGPYKFVERIQNDRIVLDKFDQYYDAKDYAFKRLTFLPIPDTTVRLSNLRAGDLDLLERLNPSDVPQVKTDASLTFAPVAGLGFQQFMFNVANGKRAEDNPFKNKLVRQAFLYAIDRNAINEVAGGGIFEPAQQPFPPASPYHSDKFPPTQRDVAKAARAAQAGGLRAREGRGHVRQQHHHLVGGRDGAGHGVRGRFRPVAAPDRVRRAAKESAGGNFQVVMLGWSGRVDPDGNIHAFVTCKGALNDGHYCNAEVDKLLNEARTVPDEAKRRAIYDQAQAIIQDELPGVYNYYQPWPFALARKVKSFVPYPDGMIRLKGVTFAQK